MHYRPGIMNYLQAFKKDNFMYFAVPKNGLITFADFFRRNGWEYVNLNIHAKDENTYTYFSHIRNPHLRHTKGIVEMLGSYFVLQGGTEYLYEVLSRDEQIAKLITLTILDQHTVPICSLLPEEIDPYSVHWIPLDHPIYTSEYLTNNFFEKHGLDLRIEMTDRKHQSNSRTKEIHDLINRLKDDFPHYKSMFTSSVLKEDLNLYDKIMKEIS